jgi:hypothetical protein
MRLSSVRIIWITFVSTFTLLASSIVSSSPLMTFKMFQLTSASESHQITVVAQLPDCLGSSLHTHMDHDVSPHSSHSLSQSSSQPCDSHSESPHNCCSATCINILAFLPSFKNTTHFASQLSPIDDFSWGERVHRPQSLYRPPIA